MWVISIKVHNVQYRVKYSKLANLSGFKYWPVPEEIPRYKNEGTVEK